ncbi:MAG: helix-turn-helix domain-containing protein [Acutalibacteraceae bacterium]
MALIYKIDVLSALKAAGYNTTRLRKEKMLSESTIQKFRNKLPVSWENLETLCRLLNMQIGDIIEYVPDEATE